MEILVAFIAIALLLLGLLAFRAIRKMQRTMQLFAYKIIEVTESHNHNTRNIANYIVNDLQEKAKCRPLSEEEQAIFHACRKNIAAYDEIQKGNPSEI